MQAPEELYVTMQSSATQIKNGRISTNFKQPVKLQGTYEAAVVDVIYTKSFYNVNEAVIDLFLSYKVSEDYMKTNQEVSTFLAEPAEITQFENDRMFFELPARNGESHLLKVPAGYYDKAEDLVEAINKLLKTVAGAQKTPIIVLDQTTHKITSKTGITPLNGYIYPKFSEQLMDIFGLGEFMESQGEKMYGKAPVDLLNKAQFLYLLCPLVKTSYVDEKWLPLLRVLEVSHGVAFGQTCVGKFPNNHYIRVDVCEFTNIDCYFKYEDSTYVDFMFGRIALTLHLRKIK